MIFGKGGEDRVCLLDDEETVVPGTMRATGDWVSVRDSQLYYLGRRDRTIKRHGKRVDLDSVQRVRCFYVYVLPKYINIINDQCHVKLHLFSLLRINYNTNIKGNKKVVVIYHKLLLSHENVECHNVIFQE